MLGVGPGELERLDLRQPRVLLAQMCLCLVLLRVGQQVVGSALPKHGSLLLTSQPEVLSCLGQHLHVVSQSHLVASHKLGSLLIAEHSLQVFQRVVLLHALAASHPCHNGLLPATDGVLLLPKLQSWLLLLTLPLLVQGEC